MSQFITITDGTIRQYDINNDTIVKINMMLDVLGVKPATEIVAPSRVTIGSLTIINTASVVEEVVEQLKETPKAVEEKTDDVPTVEMVVEEKTDDVPTVEMVVESPEGKTNALPTETADKMLPALHVTVKHVEQKRSWSDDTDSESETEIETEIETEPDVKFNNEAEEPIDENKEGEWIEAKPKKQSKPENYLTVAAKNIPVDRSTPDSDNTQSEEVKTAEVEITEVEIRKGVFNSTVRYPDSKTIQKTIEYVMRGIIHLVTMGFNQIVIPVSVDAATKKFLQKKLIEKAVDEFVSIEGNAHYKTTVSDARRNVDGYEVSYLVTIIGTNPGSRSRVTHKVKNIDAGTIDFTNCSWDRLYTQVGYYIGGYRDEEVAAGDCIKIKIYVNYDDNALSEQLKDGFERAFGGYRIIISSFKCNEVECYYVAVFTKL